MSGINNGANMGDDTIYSGTVGAAMEGYLFGAPAIAFSQVSKGWKHIDAAAAKARELVLQMGRQSLVGASPWLLNVNIPNLPLEQIKPWRSAASDGAIPRAGDHPDKPAWRDQLPDRLMREPSRTTRKALTSMQPCRGTSP